MKIFGILLTCIFALLVYFYILGGEPSIKANALKNTNDNNYNGQYNVSYLSSSSLCGELGYQFKMKHQRDGYSESSMMRKSNCRNLGDGTLIGYIYPANKPSLRVFWISKQGVLSYLD